MKHQCRKVDSTIVDLTEEVRSAIVGLNNQTKSFQQVEKELQAIYSSIVDRNRDKAFREVMTELGLDTYNFNYKNVNPNLTPQLVIQQYDIRNMLDLFQNASDAYNYTLKKLQQLMFKYTLLDRSKNAKAVYIRNGIQFNNGIANLKNFLMNTIAQNLGMPTVNLFNTTNTVSFEAYQDFMNSPQVQNFISVFKPSANILSNIKDFDTFSALFILNNFDALLSKEFDGIVEIDSNTIGSVTNTDYSRIEASESTLYWQGDDLEETNAENYLAKLAKFIISVIPKVHKTGTNEYEDTPGKFMSTADLFRLSGLLRQAEYEYALTHPDFEGMHQNPNKAIRTLLTAQDTPNIIKENMRDFMPLIKFLYQGDEENYPVASLYLAELRKPLNVNKTQTIDIESLLTHALKNTTAPTYLQYDGHGIATQINYSQSSKSSGRVSEQLANAMVQAKIASPESGDTSIFTKPGITIQTGDKSAISIKYYDLAYPQGQVKTLLLGALDNQDFKEMFNAVFQQELTPILVALYGQPEKFIKDMAFLFDYISKTYNSLNIQTEGLVSQIQQINKAVFDAVEDRKKGIAKIDAFQKMASILSAQEDNVPYTTFNNYSGSSIPVFRISSAAFNDLFYLQNYRKLHPWQARLTNFLAANPNILSQRIANPFDIRSQHKNSVNYNYRGATAVKLDVGSRDSSKTASHMSTQESFMSSFIGDFLSLLYGTEDNPNTGVMAIQPTEFSDKSSVIDKVINMQADVLVNPWELQTDKQLFIPLQDLTPPQLLEIAYFYRKNMFVNLVDSVLQDWNEYFPGEITLLNPDNVVTMLQSQHLSEEHAKELQNAWSKLDQFLKQAFMPTANEKDSAIEKLQRMTKNGPALTQQLHYSYAKKRGLEVNRSITAELATISSFENFRAQQGERLRKLEAFANETKMFIEGHKKDFPTLPSSIDSGLISKYMFITNIIQQAYLDLTSKEPFVDVVKNKYKDDVAEADETFRATTKRMVIFPGTVENFQQKLINGVSPSMKLAVIDDLSELVYSPTGATSGQDVFDGSCFINPIQSRLENNSIPGRGIQGTKKTLGMHTGANYATLYKWAEFPLTNEKIRNAVAITSGRENKISFDKVMQKMLGLTWTENIDITRNILSTDSRKIINSIEAMSKGKGVFYQNGIYYYKILDIKNIGENTYDIVTSRVDRNGNRIVDENGAPDVRHTTEVITDLYKLWKILGGYNSKELIDGVLQNSEQSLDILTEYVINTGSNTLSDNDTLINQDNIQQPLRNYFISIIANKSGVKRGATNVNNTDMWFNNEPINYSEVDTSNFGIQLDANHESDMSEMSETTQTMSALASNGNAIREAQITYDQIAAIIRSNLEKITDVFEDFKQLRNTKFAEEVSKQIEKDLQTSRSISIAESIINKLKQTAGDSNIVLPFSNNNFFKLLAANILSDLNRLALKRKYSGVGGIVNPSSNVMQLYRLDGQPFLYNDLINKAMEWTENTEYVNLDWLEEFANNTNSNATERLVQAYLIMNYSPIADNCYQTTVDANGEESITINREALQEEMLKLDNGQLLQSYLIRQDQVQPLETYLFRTINSKDLQSVYLNNPNALREFKQRTDIIEVYQSIGTPSDLKPQDITWEVDGINHSIWESESVEMQFMIEDIMGDKYNGPSTVLSDLSDLGNEITRKEC